jgi:hypothetical protein
MPSSRVSSPSARSELEIVREELVELASQVMASDLPDSGRSMLRLSLEADRIPGLQRHWASVAEAQIRAARDIVHRALYSGELPKGTSATLVLDTLCGGVILHALSAPRRSRRCNGSRLRPLWSSWSTSSWRPPAADRVTEVRTGQ